ncbi:MAG: carbon monoxide dehydrogenase [Actinophytocola sp.]|uniref:SRPBCC family protein n=1 Tax=Actinophytocola sp. TaxID=1872138 RepID=UPI0013215F59|nr:SRPBCC family protein [Actinophytocola sp.]MPZ80160.1 carbon monoxide dehydrogenase [Actinophytocola sp.]
MKLEHSFVVPADLDTVWAAVLDPERVAPCMPGASLSEVDGDSFKGTVKVKVGPISLQYKGSGEFLEKDEAARKVVIKASGKDTRGNGTASATVTVSLRAEGDATAGSVDTDLSITGKPAQFGRGLISEVGGKILDSFVSCLAKKLGPEQVAEQVAEPPPAEAPKLSVVESERADAADTGAKAGEAAATAKPAAKPATKAKPAAKPKLAAVDPQPESEPIDLLAYAGPSVLKRVVPLAVAIIVVLVVITLRRRRG